MSLVIVDHPLVAHRLTQLRDESCPPDEFRRLAREITQLVGYEALRDLPVENVLVNTPMQAMQGMALASNGPVIVPILRAGLGMLDGLTSLIPTATVGLVGLRRDESTAVASAYCVTLPDVLDDRDVIICDPMLATGGSLLQTAKLVIGRGAASVRAIVLVAAPEGVARLEQELPELRVFTAALDERLNDSAYILPGLGDAGDRLFGPPGSPT